MENKNEPLERVNSWIKNSVTLKLITITILMLLLLIPTAMIESIIEERQASNMQATDEVSAKWANEQLINGPVLSIPVIYEYLKDDKLTEVTKYWKILPNELTVNGEVIPKSLNRGIYEVIVYDAALAVSGNFIIDETFEKDNIKEIKYDRAFLTVGISDMRGIKDQVSIKFGKSNLKVQPGSKIPDLIKSGITAQIPQVSATNKPLPFQFNLGLQGSQQLSFTPIGSTTKVNLTSAWDSPSFNGSFLPRSREVNENGFEASWKVLELNRNFPQSWIGHHNLAEIETSAFGVDLIMPIDDYQKSIRSVKYGAMTVALTFLTIFLVEVIKKRRIHPFQYAFVGLALCLFYILLISISEHLNFNLAYFISTVSVVTMIGLYAISVFNSKRISLLLILIIIGVYCFLFTTLQLADYALLLGSIGLTAILGLAMYYTRNINWYKLNMES
ncbi:MAG: cell envelope integrity protein CreD [Fulvivirga sp.]